MTNQKKRVNEWIRLLIDIALQLSTDGFRLSVNTGAGLLIVPGEVFKVLQKRNLLLKNHDTHFFQYGGEHGETLIQVIANPDADFTFKLMLKQ